MLDHFFTWCENEFSMNSVANSWCRRQTQRCDHRNPEKPFPSGQRSKTELQPELHLTGTGGEIRAPYLSRRLTERAGIGCQISGLSELDAIKQIVGLPPKLQIGTLRES